MRGGPVHGGRKEEGREWKKAKEKAKKVGMCAEGIPTQQVIMVSSY